MNSFGNTARTFLLGIIVIAVVSLLISNKNTQGIINATGSTLGSLLSKAKH